MAAYSLADILRNTQQLQPTPRQEARERVCSPRSRNRAGAWAYDLAQWREYRLALADGADERADIEREYAERVAAGPDFCSYRSGSEFAEAPLHQLDVEGRRQVLAAFDAAREWHFKNARRPHGQGVSLRYREVLRFLLNVGIRYGRIFPALATIARACCCSVKTVSNALSWLRAWGFLTWQRRIRRVQTRLGTAVRQASNAYRIALSGLAEIGARVLCRASVRNNSQPSRSTISSRYNVATEIGGAG